MKYNHSPDTVDKCCQIFYSGKNLFGYYCNGYIKLLNYQFKSSIKGMMSASVEELKNFKCRSSTYQVLSFSKDSNWDKLRDAYLDTMVNLNYTLIIYEIT